MGNPYPADVETSDGTTVVGGQINFTTGNQPGGGGLPTGWTVNDPDPGTLNGGTDGSGVFLTADGDITGVYGPDAAEWTDGDGSDVGIGHTGVTSGPSMGAAFTAVGGNGATVALNAGGLPVTNLPSADPHIAGALWNNAGTPAISAG